MKKVLMLVMVLCFGFSLTAGANAQVYIGFEAEAGVNGADSIGSSLTTIADPMASGGLAVGTAEGVGDSNNSIPADGIAVYSFWAPAGRYYVLARLRSDTSDSIWVRIADSSGNSVNDNVNNNSNEPDWVRWNSFHMPSGGSRTPEYRWDVCHSDDHGQRQARFDLPADGNYTLEWARREDGVYVDGLVITNALGIDQRVMPQYIPGAEGPATTPADGATGVGLNDTIVSWDAVDGASYDIWAGTSPALLSEVGLGIIGAGGTASFDLATVLPFGFSPDTTYYWELVQDGEYLAAGSFTTVTDAVVIVSQPPAAIALGTDCVADLVVDAKSGDDDAGPALSFQWSDSMGDIAGATAATYSTDVPETYTCTVTNGNPDDDGVTDPAVVTAPEHLGFFSTGLTNGDINGPGQAGWISHIPGSGAITVAGGGNDIWGSADKCHFAYREWTGDGEWICRMTDMYNPNNSRDMDAWIKSGIMARQNLTGGSQNSSMLVSWRNGATFQRRENADGDSQSTREAGNRPALERPHQWLKLTREGNRFYGFYALDDGGKPGQWFTDRADGYNVNLTDPIFIGLAVTSHNDGRLAACDFDNLGGDFGSTWAVVPNGPDPQVGQDPTNPVLISWEHSPSAVLPCGAITYDFVLETDAAAAADPAATPLVAGTGDMQVELTGLVEETDYFYRIDTVYGAEIERGIVQLFRTDAPPILTPVIVAQPAPWTMGADDEEVTLTCIAESPLGDAVDYSWMYGIGDSNDVEVGTDSELAVTIGAGTTAASYRCITSNTYGEGDTSIEAKLGIKAQIGHWSMDAKVADPNGKVVEDSVGGNDGLLMGATEPNLVPGVKGFAIDLNGVDHWIDVRKLPSELGIDGNHPRSFSAWVYTRAMNDGAIWDMGQRSGGMDFCLRTESESRGDHGWRVQHWGGAYDHNFNTFDPTNNNEPWGFTEPFATAFPSLNAWVLFVHTHDGSRMKIYGNGQLIVDVPRNFNTGNDFGFRIGHYGPNNEKFDGLIDDVQAFNYALDAVTIINMYREVVTDAVLCAEFVPLDYDGDCMITIKDFAVWAASFGLSGVVN